MRVRYCSRVIIACDTWESDLVRNGIRSAEKVTQQKRIDCDRDQWESGIGKIIKFMTAPVNITPRIKSNMYSVYIPRTYS